jgi:hypothetical protein
MGHLNGHKTKATVVVLMALLLGVSVSCGNHSFFEDVTALDPSQTICASGVAQINVTDGFLHAVCGCAESGSEPTAPPARLTCTVPVGTIVIFYYQHGTQLLHQIVPTDSPAITSSPVSDPILEIPIRVHSTRLTGAGNYRFHDSFNNALSGEIVVQ